MFLKRIKIRVKGFTLPKVVKNVILVVFPLLILDFLVVLAVYYLKGNSGLILGRSEVVMLSDLLFLEGIVILALGIFYSVGREILGVKTSSEKPTEATDNAEQSREKRIHLGIFMAIVGVSLIGLSILVGTLFLT